jgi:hypothetical protein
VAEQSYYDSLGAAKIDLHVDSLDAETDRVLSAIDTAKAA